MSLFGLACSNFKRSVKEYASLIIALAFSVFIFFNFQNVVFSDSMDVLENFNKDYIDMIVQAASFIFGVFLFFFIWYATDVFLSQRKREIGIYTFMGLDNVRIGKMYAIEAFLIGVFSLAAGLVFGILFSKLFQMLLLRISDISVDIRFSFSLPPVLITSVIFGIIYGIMIIKGYVSIVRSSVLSMLSDAKRQEMKNENIFLTIFKVVLGLAVLGTGYVFAINTGGLQSLVYGLLAVILVVAGTYLLYGGAIPFFIRKLTENKKFLYEKERNLWVNNLAYRIRRNYRTYGIVTVLMICSVTVLATSIALKQRYEKMIHFQEHYFCQVTAMHRLDKEQIEKGISEKNQVLYGNEISLTLLNPDVFHRERGSYGIVPCSVLKEAAKEAELDFPYEDIKEDEAVYLSHVYLMSFMEFDPNTTAEIGEESYHVLAQDDTAYLGRLQESMNIYVVSDKTYEKLKTLGLECFIYGFQIAEPENAEASRAYLDTLVEKEGDSFTVGYNMFLPDRGEMAWIPIMYSLCVFMFVTLILAAGSIIFIKLNNDAYEDIERYKILKKLGVSEDVLKRAMKHEIRFTYYCPFVLMVITSYFSVRALGNVMKTELTTVNVYSAVAIILLFFFIYLVSVRAFQKKVLK